MAAEFLNRFITVAWPYAADLLSNEIIQGAWESANSRGLHLHVSETSVDIAALPRFSVLWTGPKPTPRPKPITWEETGPVTTPPGMQPKPKVSGPRLWFRLPGTGSYSISTYVEKHIPAYPDIGLNIDIDLSVDMTITDSDKPARDPHVSISIGSFVGEIADWAINWKGKLENQIGNDLGMYMGFFDTVRYDPSIQPTIPNPELMHGFAELDSRKAIDVVLVSDGFTSAEMADFRAVADAFQTSLTTFLPSRMNEPFFSFDTVIRIWKLEVPSNVPDDLSHRVVSYYFDVPSGSDKASLANLARLDAIGPKAESVGADVIAFVSHKKKFGTGTRAMTMGNLIMLPAAASTAAEDASVLVHELGHSILGGLADEYFDDHPDIQYHGKEPMVPNVTAENPSGGDSGWWIGVPAIIKWARWTLSPEKLPSWDRFPIKGFEGARYYGLGIWRPAQNCKMLAPSDDVQFCAVCREALTRGMRRILGSDSFLIEIAYPDLGDTKVVQTGSLDAANRVVHRVRVFESGTTQVRMRLLASTLPKPWAVSFAFTGIGPTTIQGIEATFTAQLGDVLKMTISSGCQFVPWDAMPVCTLEIRCDLPLRQIPQEAPSVPTNLRFSFSTAGRDKPFRTRLSASSFDPNADDIKFRFEITDETGAFTGQASAQSDWRSWTQASPTVTGSVDVTRLVSPGGIGYKFRVQAVDVIGRFSDWSDVKTFTVPEPVESRVKKGAPRGSMESKPPE